MRTKYWKFAEHLLVDDALYITVLAILLAAFVFLKVLEAANYDKDKIRFLEDLHFYTYAVIQLILGYDLIMKFIGIVVNDTGDKRKQ